MKKIIAWCIFVVVACAWLYFILYVVVIKGLIELYEKYGYNGMLNGVVFLIILIPSTAIICKGIEWVIDNL